MKFGEFALAEAEGVRLAHTLAVPGCRLRKGHVLTVADIAALAAAAVTSVLGARLDAADIDEDRAAAQAAALLASDGLLLQAAAQGRCNIAAGAAGMLVLEAATIDSLNRIDAALTVATRAPFAVVAAGQVVATVKSIPFAVASATLAEWKSATAAAEFAPLRLLPFTPRRLALICSRGSATSEKLLAATEAVTRRRVSALGSELAITARCDHDTLALHRELRAALNQGAELILVAGAAVSKDRGDTIPAAIVAAGGEIVHFGMPVEPGNMLLLGRIGAVPVINLPGCARSPRRNGLDWVLARLLAGVPVGAADIMAMGVGGLILSGAAATQGEANEGGADTTAQPPRIAALVLAAGRSSRMGETNKLLCPVDGRPMLLHALTAALDSRCVQTLLVSGHDADAIEAAAQTQPLSVVRNPDYAAGMASSLRCGLRALPRDLDGVVVLLADMPRITAAHIDALIAAFDPATPTIVAPQAAGRRGNPVLWPRRHFAAMQALAGDQGARSLLDKHAGELTLVEVHSGDTAIFTDVDTPAALLSLAAG